MEKWGEAAVELHAKGETLPEETAVFTREAGARGGKEFSKSFEKSASPGLRRSLDNFSKSFKAWDKNLASNDKNMGNLARRTKAFLRTVGNTEPMIKFRLGMQDIGQSLKNWADASDKATASGGRQGSMWKKLSANTRQWTAIIAAVIGSFGDLAALGSAAGSGLFVLAGGFAELAAAGGLAFVAFRKFTGDIKKLPPALKPARAAFDGFKKSVTQAMDAMTVEAFKGTETAWKHFGAVVKDLQPGFKAVGKAVNGLIKDLSKNLDPSMVKTLNTFLENSAKVMDRVVRAAGRLGKALLIAFTSPAFLKAQEGFLSWIDQLVNKFSKFLSGSGGGFNDWLKHGQEIFGALGPLLDTTGTLLNNMVTDQTVQNLVDFIGHINNFLKVGAPGILDVAQKLDIFGLIALALDEFGKALAPLAQPLGELATALNDIVKSGIDTLAGILGDVAQALAPVVKGIADFAKTHPKQIADAILIMAAAWVVFKGAKGIAGVAGLIGDVVLGLSGISTKVSDLDKKKGKINGIATAIAGIGIAWVGLTDNKGGGGITAGGGDALMSILGGSLSGAFAGLPGILIGGLIGAVASMIQDMFLSPKVKGAWATGWAQLFDPSDFSGAVIGPLKQWFLGPFADTISSGWQGAMGSITGFLGGMNEGIKTFAAEAQINWNNFWTGLGTGVNDAIGNILGPVTTFLGTMNEGIKKFAADTATNWNNFWGGLPVAVDTAGSNVQTTVTGWWGRVSSGFATWWSGIASGWNAFWGGLPGVVNTVGANIESSVKGWWSRVAGAFSGWYGSIAAGWNSFWGGLLGAVSRFGADVQSNVSGWFGGLVGAFQRGFQNVWNTVTGWVGQITSKIRNFVSSIPLIGGAVSGILPKAANGMILNGPTHIIGGEAGPEAVVPLRRSLALVNKSVRGLSAIAQGKTSDVPGVSTGGNSRTLNVQPGAIVIQGVRDPNAAALGVVNRLAERIAG